MRLHLLTAWELLAAQAEAERGCGETAALGLWQNACLIARAATCWGRRIFPDGAAVLRRCTPEEIERLAAQYQTLAAREDPHCGQPPEKTEAMLDRLRSLPEARIEWKVQRAFGVLPTEPRARRMHRRDYLDCVLQLLLDEEERLERLCPECRERAESGVCPGCGRQWENSGKFDEARYEALRAGRTL